MKVIFLGTGEAFDENYLNNSSLVITGKTKLLLDCGMTTPYQLWKYNNDQNLLDAVYISHSHADHYFGLPALLVRMWEEKRKKPITVFSQKGLEKKIKDLMEMGYKGCKKKLSFKINFKELDQGQIVKFKDLSLSIAKGKHSISNFAIRIENNKKILCYSGDGTFTKNTKKLYKDADLLIHEAYLYDKKEIGHARIIDLIKVAERNNVKCLALTHIDRKLRKGLTKRKIHSKKVNIKVPNNFKKIII